MDKKENVIWCDFQPEENWNFNKGLNEATGIEWKRIVSINNDKSSKTANVKRYFGYFNFTFKQFLKREDYSNIIAWQQFYGLIYAFFCRLFNAKKVNNLYIMIFIYIPKKGLLGKVYKKFMSYIVTSKYIEKIFVFSSAESKRYEKELGVSSDKFVFLPFGDDVKKTDEVCDFEENFIFSSGYSNRDFDFLVDALKGTSYTVRIYGWENYIKDNIIMSNEVVGNRLDAILEKCKLVVVPLKENRESGQFTILHAMEAGVPVIATDTDCMKDYIVDGVNGYTCANEKQAWLEKINLLYSDDELYDTLADNCKRLYEEKHTQIALGRNVGNSIKDSKIRN